ncbi:MAG TPA: type VI secretion system amidase effector protein Tae4 [Polyangia bacterium]|jgi:hypothetical protein
MTPHSTKAYLGFALAALLLTSWSCSSTSTGPGAYAEEPLDPLNDGGEDIKADLPARTLPPLATLWEHYPLGTADEVKKLIGGNVNADWIVNTCAIRLSRALNYSGFAIPGNVPGLNTVKGGDGKRYAYRVAELNRYLRKVISTPDIVSTDEAAFAGQAGIIMFEVNWSDATGHLDLWNGTEAIGHEYFDVAYKVSLWRTP